MQTMEMEMAGVFFVPNNGHIEWAIEDLTQMKIGTLINGTLVIRKDTEPTEYINGTIEVHDDGIEFNET